MNDQMAHRLPRLAMEFNDDVELAKLNYDGHIDW